MRQLSKTQSIILLIGACLMVIGVAAYVFNLTVAAPWIFAVGSVAFAVMQMQQVYEGKNFTIKRLRRIMVLGDFLFVLSAFVMIENANRFLLPFFLKYMENGYNAYVTYLHNNWVVLLLVAAILEMYTTHRISSELDKEAGKETKKL